MDKESNDIIASLIMAPFELGRMLAKALSAGFAIIIISGLICEGIIRVFDNKCINCHESVHPNTQKFCAHCGTELSDSTTYSIYKNFKKSHEKQQ